MEEFLVASMGGPTEALLNRATPQCTILDIAHKCRISADAIVVCRATGGLREVGTQACRLHTRSDFFAAAPWRGRDSYSTIRHRLGTA
jgi:hypothetical protein